MIKHHTLMTLDRKNRTLSVSGYDGSIVAIPFSFQRDKGIQTESEAA